MIRNLLTTLGLRFDPTPPVVKSPPQAPAKTILIVDDNPDTLRTICVALAGETFRLETANTAETALRKMFTSRPDLILIDSRVSAADGTRFASRLLADEDLAAVPIVELTGMPPRPCGDRYDGRLAKPIDPHTFPGEIRAFLEPPAQPQTVREADVSSPAHPGIDRRQQAANLLDAIEAGLPDSQFAPGMARDLHQLVEAVGGLEHYELADYLHRAEKLSRAATPRARSRFRSLIRLCGELVRRDPDAAPGMADLRNAYMENRRAELNRLNRALGQRDFASLAKAGHNLKGTGAAYGFAELTDIGRAMETSAKQADAAAVAVLLDRIETYVGIVSPSPKR